MKKLFGLLFVVTLSIISAIELFACGTVGTSATIASSGGIILAAPPAVTLDTQKIVFLTSLKEEYERIDTWLHSAEDLSMFVEQGQTLVFPEAGEDPAVYKNRETDIDSVEPKETVFKVELDVYDSQNYKMRNIHLHALPFEKIQHYTRKAANAIVKAEIADAAYTLAPETAGRKRIILPTTGNPLNGVKMMKLDDIITLARACDRDEFPGNRNLVLPSDMWWDLVNNNEILKGQLERQANTGTIDPSIVEYYGIRIHKSLGDKLGITWDLNANSKSPQGTAIDIAGGVVPAALFFCGNQVFRAGGKMELFYTNKSENPTGRAYVVGFQHRFKADFQMDAQRYSGLIYADKA